LENSNHISQEELERIEKYLSEAMSIRERIAFDDEMASNVILRHKTEEVRIILEEIETDSMVLAMEEFHEELTNTESLTLIPPIAQRRTIWWPWTIVASLALVLSLWVLLMRESPNERLFTAYYEPDPGLVTAMGNSVQYEFERAMVDYKMGQYQSAIDRWEKLLKEKYSNDTLNYFLGSSYLALQQTDKAAFYFQSTLIFQGSIFSNDAWWYLGLTWLKKGELLRAKEAFQKSNKPEAKTLLTELEKE
jgi:tetratricopeptide (TPR) repeat protein